jgi:UDP-glucose 4-epimerase
MNLGADEYCEVNDSVGWICDRLGVSPAIEYSGGNRGWIGDNPFIFLDTTRMRKMGWSNRYNIRESVIKTVDYLASNTWLFETRK